MQPLPLFQYNWQVREEYFQCFASLSEGKLLERRTGGYGNTLHTLAHIVLVEQGWARELGLEPPSADVVSRGLYPLPVPGQGASPA